MTDGITKLVKIQYPTNDPHSLQRSITQIKELLEDPDFWQAVGTQLGDVTIRLFSSGGSGGGGGVSLFIQLNDTPNSYTGSGGKWVRVKQDVTGLEYDDVEWDDVLGKPADFPPGAHTHQLSEVPASIVDGVAYVRLDDAWVPLTESLISDLDRLRWRGNWVQQEYQKNDVVLGDANWLMVANKTTTEVAPPREDPDTEAYDMPESPPWVEESFNGVVESGRIWTTTEPITVVGYQVWVPELSTDTSYRVKVYREPVGQPEQREFMDFGEPILVEDGWATVAISQTLIPGGFSFAIILDALNSGSTTVPGGTPADWVRGANSNSAGPVSGEWNRSNNNSILRIHETTADAALIDLNGAIAGTKFEMVSTTNPNQSITYVATTNETYANNVYSWSVDVDTTGPSGEPPVGTRCIISIQVPVPSPTKYVVQLAGNPTHTWGTSEGVLHYNGSLVNGRELDAFGVRVLTREWDVPVDWDIMSAVGAGSGGGGGSGGSSTFVQLTDTPDSYAGRALQLPRVTSGEAGLEFFDANTVYVPAAGGTFSGAVTFNNDIWVRNAVFTQRFSGTDQWAGYGYANETGWTHWFTGMAPSERNNDMVWEVYDGAGGFIHEALVMTTDGDLSLISDVTINAVNPAIFLHDTDGTADEKITRIMQDGNRLRFSRMDDAGTATTLALLDQGGWTVRNSDGGTWPIMQSNGNIKAVAGLFESGVFLRSDSSTGVSFRDAAEDEFYKIFRDVSGNTLDVYKSDAGTNDRIIGRFEDQGPDLPDDRSIVTKEKLLANSQSPITVGDTLPVSPNPGDQHYLTVQPVGMYFYYDDGDSQQWVQQNGTSLPPDLDPDQFVQKSGDVMTGPLTISGGSGVPVFSFERTDNAAGDKRGYLSKNSDGNWSLANTDDDGSNARTLVNFREDKMQVQSVSADAFVGVSGYRKGGAYHGAGIIFDTPRSDTADGNTVAGRGIMKVFGDASSNSPATISIANQTASLSQGASVSDLRNGNGVCAEWHVDGKMFFWGPGGTLIGELSEAYDSDPGAFGSGRLLTRNAADQRYATTVALDALLQKLETRGAITPTERAEILALTQVEDDNG